MRTIISSEISAAKPIFKNSPCLSTGLLGVILFNGIQKGAQGEIKSKFKWEFK